MNSLGLSLKSSVIYPRSKQTLRAFCLANCAVFKVRQEGEPHTWWLFRPGPQKGSGAEKPAHGRSLKTQQHVCACARFAQKLGRHARNTHRPLDRQAHSLVKELPRKEVIQPHLPVRLPCYDFTPITSPTFDGSLPKGLGHRLRVLPAFVV